MKFSFNVSILFGAGTSRSRVFAEPSRQDAEEGEQQRLHRLPRAAPPVLQTPGPPGCRGGPEVGNGGSSGGGEELRSAIGRILESDQLG